MMLSLTEREGIEEWGLGNRVITETLEIWIIETCKYKINFHPKFNQDKIDPNSQSPISIPFSLFPSLLTFVS